MVVPDWVRPVAITFVPLPLHIEQRPTLAMIFFPFVESGVCGEGGEQNQQHHRLCHWTHLILVASIDGRHFWAWLQVTTFLTSSRPFPTPPLTRHLSLI